MNQNQNSKDLAPSPVPPGKPNKVVSAFASLKTKFRKFWTLTRLMVTVVVLSVLFTGSLAGYVAVDLIYSNKLRDSWAILFLNLERMATVIQAELENCCQISEKVSNRIYAHYIINETNSGELLRRKGPMPAQLQWYDFGFKGKPLEGQWYAVTYGEKKYFLERRDSDVYLWRGSVDPWLGGSVKFSSSDQKSNKVKNLPQTKIYAITRQGFLLYSNTSEVDQINFNERPLVKQFIQKKITKSQIELNDPRQGQVYGYFQEISKTNIVLFAETFKVDALSEVREQAINFSAVFFGILLVSALTVVIPTTRLLKPIGELSRLAAEIGSGNFSVMPTSRGAGELGPLVDSFAIMVKKLNSRDRSILALNEDRVSKVRLANEIAIAKSLQDNFVKSPASLGADIGIQIESRYQAAEECAGDWYACHFDPVTKDLVIAIADVSGHGVGSSMFTAVIAALFDERLKDIAQNHEDFCQSVHARLRSMAAGRMHASLQLVTWQHEHGRLQITNAGHPFPMVQRMTNHGPKVETLKMPSSPCGFSGDFATKTLTIDVKEGFRMLLYTDGLTEGRQAKTGALFGSKRVFKAFSEKSTQPIGVALDFMMVEWKRHMNGGPVADDICTIMLHKPFIETAAKVA